jgi:regulator of sigma E protease
MTILIFLAVLFVLVLVHEWGHFIVAKKTGMRVDEFAIGFPPKLFGIKKGETEYTINLLPIGGFVRIFGENAQDASHASLSGEDTSGSFTSKSKWAQVGVLIAGVTMNIILAWFLFVVVFLIGVPTSVPEDEATDEAYLTVTSVLPGSPAEQAGLTVGSQIIRYSNDESEGELTPTAFQEHSSDSVVKPMTITFLKGTSEETVDIVPSAGLIASDQNQPAIGVSLALVENVKKPIGTALVDATLTTYNTLIAIVIGMGSLFADMAQFKANLSQVAGPIGIVGLVGDAARFGFTSLLMFTAIISLNLAVINLLPFPALDGGRLLFVVIETIIRRPINPVWVMRLNTLGFLLLMLLMIVISYSDIAKLFR